MALLFSHWSNVKQNRLHYGRSSQDENFIFTNEVYINVKCVCVCTRACVQSCSVVSNSLRPYGLYPTRFLCPWDSPGKKTGVVATPSSRGSSQPRCKTHLFSCIGRWVGFLFVCFYHKSHLGSLPWVYLMTKYNLSWECDLVQHLRINSIIYHSKDLKKKNHLTLSEDIENDFWPNSTSIRDNPPKNTKDRGIFFNLRMVVYTKQLLIS